jgi:hypothetical protein
LIGGHGIYQFYDFKLTALYAGWYLDGDDAKAASKDVQDGSYIELSYRPLTEPGFFVRQSAWSQIATEEKQQTDLGLNYWPIENAVFKFDVQIQNTDAGDVNGFNLGMGYHF